MSALFLSLAVAVVVLGKEATTGQLAESAGEGGRLAGSEQPFPRNESITGDFGENLETTTFDSVPENISDSFGFRAGKVESNLNAIEKSTSDFTVGSNNGELVTLGALMGDIGKVSSDLVDNFADVNELENGFTEIPAVADTENPLQNESTFEEITLNFSHSNLRVTTELNKMSSGTQEVLTKKSVNSHEDEKPAEMKPLLDMYPSQHSITTERTPTAEETSLTEDHNYMKLTTTIPAAPTTPCHCTTARTEARNHSMVLEDFRRLWPVDEWLSQGFFTEEYLQKVPAHWLSFPPPAPEAHYFLAAAYVVVMVIGVGGNLMVIVMFCRCKSLKTPANILVLNLAVSDLLMLLKMPIFIYNSIQLGPALGELGCQIYGFIGGLTGTVSIATLAAIGLDRYYVIVHPLDPLRRTTRMRARLCVVFVWLYGFTFSVLPLTELKLSRYVSEGFLTSCSFDYLDPSARSRSFILVFFTAAWVVPFIVLTFSYLAICHVVVHAREVPPGGDSSRHCRENDKRRTELRLAEVVLGVVGLWFISWTPYAVVALLGVSGNQHLLTPLGSMVPALLAKMASAVDPYVYAINHPRFRLELTKSWHRFKGGQPQFRASQARSIVVTMHDPTTHSSSSSQSEDCHLNALPPQEREPEAAGKPVDLPTVRRNAGLLPPTWFRPPKPKRNRSTSLRLKSRVKDIQEKTVFHSYSETRIGGNIEVE